MIWYGKKWKKNKKSRRVEVVTSCTGKPQEAGSVKDGMQKAKVSKHNWLTWLEAEQFTPYEVGGKAWNLGRLAKAGFRVPKGGVVPCQVYRHYLRFVGVYASCQKILKKIQNSKKLAQPELEKELEHIRDKIEQGKFFPALRRELARHWQRLEVQRYPVAVRSSSSTEDCGQASCAGIYTSYLQVIGIKSIIQHIKKCYASGWTMQAMLYLRKMGLVPGEMAVVIMHMIPAESAGVAFTCDPRTGNRQVMVINANWGLGEAVVNGRVDPDTYHITAKSQVPEVAHKQRGSKEGRVLPNIEGGTRFEAFTPEEIKLQRREVLNDAQLSVLGWNLTRLRGAFLGEHTHLDLEWVFNGTVFYWLQMRPVTTLRSQPGYSKRTSEMTWLYSYFTPGVQSPLSWSSLQLILERMFVAPFQAAEYSFAATQHIVRLHQGRIYFNLSFLEQEMYAAFGILPEVFGEDFGVQPTTRTVKRPATVREQWGWGRRSLKCLWQMLRQYWKADIFLQEVTSLVKSKLQSNIRSFTDQELIEHGQQIFTVMEAKRFALRSQLLYIFASVMYNALVKSLQPLFEKKSTILANSLLSDEKEMTAADYNYHLGRIAKKIKNDADAIRFFTANKFDPKKWQACLPKSSPVRKAFERFLNLHGHRGVEEIDLKNPRWKEDPTYVLECLRHMVQATDFFKLQEQKQARREAAWQEIKKQASIRRLLWIRFLVKHALKSAALREQAKSAVILPVSLSRTIALEMGGRLCKRKLLKQKKDVFYCTWPELVEVLEQHWDGKVLTGLVQERQAEEALNKKRPVQDRLRASAQGIQKPGVRRIRSEKKQFQGLGIAAGTIRARARRLQHPNEGHKLKPGDILVTSFVDPGWTPLLLQISGLVIEKGGYLSHGAIVAREYGIPAVSNVHGILNHIRDNQIITVDGDYGTVRI